MMKKTTKGFFPFSTMEVSEECKQDMKDLQDLVFFNVTFTLTKTATATALASSTTREQTFRVNAVELLLEEEAVPAPTPATTVATSTTTPSTPSTPSTPPSTLTFPEKLKVDIDCFYTTTKNDQINVKKCTIKSRVGTLYTISPPPSPLVIVHREDLSEKDPFQLMKEKFKQNNINQLTRFLKLILTISRGGSTKIPIDVNIEHFIAHEWQVVSKMMKECYEKNFTVAGNQDIKVWDKNIIIYFSDLQEDVTTIVGIAPPASTATASTATPPLPPPPFPSPLYSWLKPSVFTQPTFWKG